MVESIDDRLSLARELLQVARDEFVQAGEAKGRMVLIGLRNACGKCWLATLEATNCYFLMQGIPEEQLPDNDRGRKYFVGRYMNREMRVAFLQMRETFHIDGYYEGTVGFDEMSQYLDELEEYINDIEATVRNGPGD